MKSLKYSFFYTNSLTRLLIQIMLISDETLTFNGYQVNNLNTLHIYSKRFNNANGILGFITIIIITMYDLYRLKSSYLTVST